MIKITVNIQYLKPVLKISPDFPRIESRIFIKKDLYFESNGKYLSYIIYIFEYIRITNNLLISRIVEIYLQKVFINGKSSHNQDNE